MRYFSPLSLASIAWLALTPGTVAAQVTVNSDALKQLQATPPAVKPAAAKPATAKPAASKPSATTSKPAAPVPALATPQVAVAPPEIAKLPPPAVVPTRPPAKVVPPKPVANAVGNVVAIKNGVRLVFGADSSDLNPAMDSALRAFAKTATPGPVTLDAYAAGNTSDPSTPRRLSLARALAARAILINCGIASDKIYVRAHAPNADDAIPGDTAPADRVEVSIVPTTN